MLAESFWGTNSGLAIAIGLSFLALFALGWLLFGTAARAKQDRKMAARMASAGRSAPQVRPDKGEATWIPQQVTKFGQRFATAGGFGEAVDMRLEAAVLAVRSGEFVVASAAAAFAGAILGFAILQNPILSAANPIYTRTKKFGDLQIDKPHTRISRFVILPLCVLI